jgi:Zn-dependent peptidase ImmA (M78 family)
MTSTGIFILNKKDIEDIAEKILSEYMPEMLEYPHPLDIEYFIRECLCLEMKTSKLSEDGKVLGLIAFADTQYEWVDKNCIPVRYDIEEGTILIDTSLENQRHPGRKRFTQAHEAAHWICHRTHHSPDLRRFEFCRRENCAAIACRSDSFEHPGHSGEKVWSDEDWEEWQANNLAASLLMPKNMFLQAFHKAMEHHNISSEVLYMDQENMDRCWGVIDEIKKVFNTSRRAVELRMIRCNVLKDLR